MSSVRIVNMRASADEWEQNNRTPLDGEIIVAVNEDGSYDMKVGDGENEYTQLPLLSEVMGKLLAPKNITATESTFSLEDNTEYRLANIGVLNIQYPETNFETWMRISFSQSGNVGVNFPAETKYIGAEPVFSNGQTWEISIKDGVAVCWRVE